MQTTFLRRAVLAGFFLSGITGLVYQGIWIRMLTLVVGGTTAALTTVLIAFMGGLALGSFLFGGLADRAKSPLRAYAVIEAVIGLYACLIPTVYQAVPPIYQTLDAVDPGHGPLFTVLRFVLAVTFFGAPATLMGGTLPLIVRSLSRGGILQVTVAEVYAVNTFGATLGAFLTGFVVIPTLGLYATLYVTAAVNLALGAFFWFVLGKRDEEAGRGEIRGGLPGTGREAGAGTGREAGAGTGREAGAGTGTGTGTEEGAGGSRRGLLLVFFLMGASSLSYEILWNRLLGLSFGSSVYAVSTMLTSFLMGIALGSWWLRNRVDRFPPTWATLGWLEVAIAAAAPLTGLVLAFIPHVVQYFFMFPYIATKLGGPGAADAGFWTMQLALFLLATAVMIVPTSLMGASFPLAVRLYADRAIGASVGRVYASNTFGSIVGLFLTGFLFIRAFGTHATSIGWSVVNGLLGVGLLTLSLRRKEGAAVPRHPAMAALGLGLLFLLVPGWSLETLTAGVYYHAMELSNPTLKGDIIFHTEDDMGLVSVHRTEQWDQPDPTHTVKINGKFMAGDGNRLPVLHLFAHLPLFVRGDGAKNAFVIGLGGGYTVEAALQHPLEKVDVAEISPGVVDAARVTRPKLFEDPRLTVLEEDARSLLLTGDEKYDVIISETSDPWMTGVANLYTLECFRWISQKLAPGGVFGTWLQTRHKTIEDVRIILRTMQEAFPHFAVFQIAEGDTVLIMSNDPLRLDAPFLKARHTLLAAEMEAINMRSPWSLAGTLVMGPPSAKRYLEGARINTDDLPVIEFSTPRSINLGFKGREVWDDLAKHAPERPDMEVTGASPAELAWIDAYRANHLRWYDRVIPAIDRAEAAGGPADPYLRARALFRLGRYEEALAQVDQAPVTPRAALLKAGALAGLGRQGDLEAFLQDGAGWAATPANNWETRVLYRRKLLLEAFGGKEQPAGNNP